MSHPQIKVVLFDVGGVLVTSRPSARTVATVLGLDPDSREAVGLVDRAMWFHRDAYDAGGTDREFWDSVAGDCGLPELDDATIASLVSEDVSRSESPDPQTLALARELHGRGYRLGILSNAPVAIAVAIEHRPWADIFDTFTFSGTLGVCKPDRGIYRAALDGVGEPAPSVLFVDDRQPNLRAAELIGMATLTWRDAERGQLDLADMGLLDSAEVA